MLDIPTYPPYYAARLTGLSVGRVNRWLRGYDYKYKHKGKIRYGSKEGLVDRTVSSNTSYASFLDLIDLIFIKRFLEHGFTVQKMRKALDEVRSLTQGHHFAQRMFWTDGSKIYVEIAKSDSKNTRALLELLSGGQWVISEVIKHDSKKIDFNTVSGFAERWFPRGRRGHIVVDPGINFGAPTIIGRGVETAIIFDVFEAEGEDFYRVSNWMDLPAPEIAHAVEFEKCLRTAA